MSGMKDVVPPEPCPMGITKREYFAGLAMQGLCNSEHMRDVATEAQLAVAMADALLEELEKQP